MDLAQAKKIGFFSALSISLGSVIGVGIFLKNNSVIGALTEGDNFSFWGLITSWIIAAIISLFAAYSFSQISTSKQSKSGLAGWVDVLGGRKQGLFVKFTHSSVYYSILVSCLPIISLEGLFYAIDGAINGKTTIHFGWIFLGGLVVFISITALNYLALKFSSRLQLIGTITKLVPLLLAIVVSLIGANSSYVINNPNNIVDTTNSDNLVNSANGLSINAIPSTNFFQITGVFSALPGILFSFDSFLTIGNLATDMKKPEKRVPIIAILTIVIAAIVYILISIGAGLTGMGSVGTILQTLFPKGTEFETARKAIDITINVFITLSAIFVVNALSMGSLKSCEGLIIAEEIMFYKKFKNLNSKRDNLGSLSLYLIQNLFYMFIFGIPAIAINNDAIFDSATNAPTLVFFLVYAYTMILGVKDRYTKKICKNQLFGFTFAAIFSSLLIFVVFCYTFFYNFMYEVAINGHLKSPSGLFYSKGLNDADGQAWLKSYDAILFWLIFLWIIILPTINYFVLKKQTPKDSHNADLFLKKTNTKNTFKTIK
ncbi:MAG: APC family permease [Malacoplasma sp.]|nr:APC family permease [Malacoplasma sp.]